MCACRGEGSRQASAGRNTRRGRKAKAAARRWGRSNGREAPVPPPCPSQAGPGWGARGRGPGVSWAGVSALSREPAHLLSRSGSGRRRSGDQGQQCRGVAPTAPEKLKKCRGGAAARPSLPHPPPPPKRLSHHPRRRRWPTCPSTRCPWCRLCGRQRHRLSPGAPSAAQRPPPPAQPLARLPSQPWAPGNVSTPPSPDRLPANPIGRKEKAGPPYWPGPHIERANGNCGFRLP